MAEIFQFRTGKRESVINQGFSTEELSMKGLEGFRTMVEESSIAPEVQADGLTPEMFLGGGRASLMLAGIRILSDEEYRQHPCNPIIYLYPDVGKISFAGRTAYCYRVAVELRQTVQLKRNAGDCYIVPTWTLSSFGITEDLFRIQEIISGFVDSFISVFEAVNRKSKGEAHPLWAWESTGRG